VIDVLRSGIFYLGYFAAVLASGIFLLPIAPFLPLARRYRLLNLYNHFLIRWFQLACGVRYDIQGRENLPNGPCVIQANHQCEWETVFLGDDAAGMHGAQTRTAADSHLWLGAAPAASDQP